MFEAKTALCAIAAIALFSTGARAERRDTLTECQKYADAWKGAYNAKNKEALVNMYDARNGLYSNSFWTASGRSALGQSFSQDFALGASMMEIKCQTSWSDGKSGVSQGTFIAVLPSPTGGTSTMNGHWMSTAEKRSGRYLILTHVSNVQLPPPKM